MVMKTPLGVVPARVEFSWEKLSGSVVRPENSQRIQTNEIPSAFAQGIPTETLAGAALSPALALNLP